MAELSNDRGGKDLLGQCRGPEPFMVSGMRSQFSLAITLALQHLFGAHHPHRLRVVDGEWQTFGIPELDLVGLMIALLGEVRIRRPRRKQAHRRLIQIP